MIIAENLSQIPFIESGFLPFAEAEEFKKAHKKDLLLLKQIHSSEVIFASTLDIGEEVEADAMVCLEPNLILGIKSADCVPILLADKKQPFVGAIHAGWKSALGGVVSNTIKALTRLGSQPKDLVAAIGPSIQMPSYEISKDFYESFMEYDAESEIFFTTDKKYFNLPAYVRAKLLQEGVENIWGSDIDTYTESAYASYRRNQTKDRNLSFIKIKG